MDWKRKPLFKIQSICKVISQLSFKNVSTLSRWLFITFYTQAFNAVLFLPIKFIVSFIKECIMTHKNCLLFTVFNENDPKLQCNQTNFHFIRHLRMVYPSFSGIGDVKPSLSPPKNVLRKGCLVRAIQHLQRASLCGRKTTSTTSQNRPSLNVKAQYFAQPPNGVHATSIRSFLC